MAAEMFGPYRLDGLLGQGGMGEVYRAFDTEQERPVALKVLPAALSRDPEYRARFRREARVASQLTDPHVVPIHRHGEIDGQLYLDMRLVDGDDLAAVLRRDGPLDPEAAVRLVEQVASALDAAHVAGLVHRDVKPSNVFLTHPSRTGGTRFAYLGDFGIARVLSSTTRAHTATGTTIGTLDYMAPERFLGSDIDARADVYALACVLHEALTGVKPFPGTELPALMHAHLNLPPPRPSQQRRVPLGLDTVVARGMAKEPARRYASAGELAAAARAALTSQTGPRDHTAGPLAAGTIMAPPAPGTAWAQVASTNPTGDQVLRWDFPGGPARVLQWLVAPGQPYPAGASLLAVRLGDGAVWQLADHRPGTVTAGRVAPGDVLASGDVVAASRRTPVGFAGGIHAAGLGSGHRPGPSKAAVVGLLVGGLIYLVSLLATPAGASILFGLLGTTVFGTMLIWRIRPRTWPHGVQVLLVIVAVPVAFVAALIIVGVAAALGGLDDTPGSGLDYIFPLSLLMTALAMPVYVLWAWTAARRRKV